MPAVDRYAGIPSDDLKSGENAYFAQCWNPVVPAHELLLGPQRGDLGG